MPDPIAGPMGAPLAFREQNTFFQAAATDGNPHPGWEHVQGELTGGQDGQEHYATHIDTSGEAPDAHDYVRNVSGKNTFQGMNVSSEAGSEAHVGSVSGEGAPEIRTVC